MNRSSRLAGLKIEKENGQIFVEWDVVTLIPQLIKERYLPADWDT